MVHSKWRGIFQYFKISKQNIKYSINIKKLYSTPPWHGARTWTVSRKYSNACSRYSAKTKRDAQTDGQTDGRTDGRGRFNISRSGLRRGERQKRKLNVEIAWTKVAWAVFPFIYKRMYI